MSVTYAKWHHWRINDVAGTVPRQAPGARAVSRQRYEKIEKEEEEFLNSVVWEAGWEELGECNAFQVDGMAVAKALRQNWTWHV